MDSIVTTKGQVVIPMDLRVKYQIQRGTRIHFAEDKGRILLVPLNEKLVDHYAGILKSPKISSTQVLRKERHQEHIRDEKKMKPWNHS